MLNPLDMLFKQPFGIDAPKQEQGLASPTGNSTHREPCVAL